MLTAFEHFIIPLVQHVRTGVVRSRVPLVLSLLAPSHDTDPREKQPILRKMHVPGMTRRGTAQQHRSCGRTITIFNKHYELSTWLL